MAQEASDSHSEQKSRNVQKVIALCAALSLIVALVVLIGGRERVFKDPLDVESRADLAKRMRFAAIDGTISVTERQAIDKWLKTDAARESARDYQAAIEASLVAAAKATAEGVEHNSHGRRKEAVKKFHEALRHDPDFLEAALNLGAAELDDKEFDAAARRLENVLTKIGSSPKAESSSKEAFEIQFDEVRARQRFFAHYNLAGCYAGQRPVELQSALSHLEQALVFYQASTSSRVPVDLILEDLEKSPNFRSLATNPRLQAVVEGFRTLKARGSR